MARHYLDHASTSPLRPEARAAMVDILERSTTTTIADPSRIHAEGMVARAIVEDARERTASFLGVRPREVVFTSGATESIATATWGAVRRAVDGGATPHVVHSAVEHSTVRRSSALFATTAQGHVSVVGVDRSGRLDVDAFVEALRPDTALAHVQIGNHEVGTRQPVAEIVDACRRRGVLVHVDATHAVGRLPLDIGALDADLVSMGSHEFGGPSGVGVLVVRLGLRLEPLLTGGEQERARRAGTEDVPGLAALGATLDALAPERLDTESALSRRHCAEMEQRLTAIDGISVLGAADPRDRLPHLLCLSVDGVEPQGVVLGLDQRGIAVHSGSSCASEDLEPSPVLEAMGVDAHRSLRLSVGWSTTPDDIDAVCRVLPEVVAGLRALGA
ncbi:MAG: cysteine desulfurase [Acidimicrobiia bacterium]|nr:cysteine desulfurase [Acidimicrobiia bacterium]